MQNNIYVILSSTTSPKSGLNTNFPGLRKLALGYRRSCGATFTRMGTSTKGNPSDLFLADKKPGRSRFRDLWPKRFLGNRSQTRRECPCSQLKIPAYFLRRISRSDASFSLSWQRTTQDRWDRFYPFDRVSPAFSSRAGDRNTQTLIMFFNSCIIELVFYFYDAGCTFVS